MTANTRRPAHGLATALLALAALISHPACAVPLGGGGLIDGTGSGNTPVPATAEHDFFTVKDADAVACQGFKGKLSLYEGANVSLLWNQHVYAG
ncbi:hypothetical protein HDU98_005231, partial [Podochytrium sp. JEL0797]